MNLDRRLFRETRAVRASLAVTALIGLIGGILLVIQARFLSAAVNRVFLESETLGQIAPLLAILVILVVLRAVLTWIGAAAAHHVAAHVKSDLRERLYAHLLALGPAYTRGERSGELATTATEGVEALDSYFSQYLPQLFLAAAVPLAILALVFPIDVVSGLVLLVTAPLIPIFMRLIGAVAGALTRRQYTALSRMGAHFLDVLQGLTTLKLFGRSRAQAEIIGRVSDAYRRATLDVLRVAFLSALVLEMLATISTAIIAVEIGLRLLAGVLEFEEAFFVLILAPEFYLPLRMLGARFHAGAAGVTAAQRIFEVLETPIPPAITPIGTQQPLLRPAPMTIRFEEVHFAYEEGARPALVGATFEVRAGQRTALVGPSGAGKSTIFQLLLRFIKPASGTISVDGYPLEMIPPEAWRTLIAWVPQTPYLFNTTVAENIRLANRAASHAAVIRAAQQANAHDFITALPEGYETEIGERGARLSGGQAQRIALARAFLRDAPLLLFDEATANLDLQTESVITEALDRLSAGRTVLVIAHRLHTVARADRILVMDGGRVVETGTHAELLRQDGVYRALVMARG